MKFVRSTIGHRDQGPHAYWVEVRHQTFDVVIGRVQRVTTARGLRWIAREPAGTVRIAECSTRKEAGERLKAHWLSSR